MKFGIPYSGDVAEAVRHARTIRSQIRRAQGMDKSELHTYAKELRVPFDLLQKTVEMGRLPVVNFAAGGLGKMSFENISYNRCKFRAYLFN